MVVDDNPNILEMLSSFLEMLGRGRVESFQSAAKALAAFRADPAIHQLVITDLEMPRTNGYELMAHLRQNPETRHIPVMVVTSRAGAKHRERALHEGAADFLVKPVQEDQLVAAVARLAGTAAKLAAQKTVAAGQAG